MKRWLDAVLASFAVRSARRGEPVELTPSATMGSVRNTYEARILLRPVNPAFIWFTLFIALAANLLPWGRSPLVPDFLALALVFWNVHQLRRVGIGAAFVFGLLMDVHDGALFGEHALAYTLLSYGAISLHRRILWLPVGAQAVHVLPLLLVAQAASLLIRMWVGGRFPGWSFFVESIVGAVLWPVISWLLLAPQRRPIERDATRPL
jgi:rod shape-determining protein MreD